MLIDRFAFECDASERHRIVVDAPPDEVYRALWRADLGSSWVIRCLLLLRTLPKRLVKGRLRTRPRRLDLEALMAAGFGKLAEEPGRELVLGIVGSFWRPVNNTLAFDRTRFDGAIPPGLARAVWNWSVAETTDGTTVLETETRIVCGDPASRRKFRFYWFFVRPFSGWIRRIMLRAVARECRPTPG